MVKVFKMINDYTNAIDQPVIELFTALVIGLNNKIILRRITKVFFNKA